MEDEVQADTVGTENYVLGVLGQTVRLSTSLPDVRRLLTSLPDMRWL